MTQDAQATEYRRDRPGHADLELELARAGAAGVLFADAQPAIRLGRYFVLERVGVGGMAVVYAAYDPQLERKVALKLLHPSSDGETDRRRLLREATALAKLSHPNVVTVHDAGTIAISELAWPDHASLGFEEASSSVVYIAMEFVDGGTLRQWCNPAPRPWQEVVDVFSQAGLGLAAAHDAGLIHRDFKPDNVMIGADGRVRVTDFGLARIISHTRSESLSSTKATPKSTSTTGGTLTMPGSILGTPAYMAPEQLEGAEASPLVDQYAFCVALFEALHGCLPFSVGSLADLVVARRESPRPGPRRVPRWLHRVMTRGLAHDPAKRYANLAALVRDLDRGVRARRRATVVAGVGLVAAVVVATRVPNDAPRCADAETRIAEIWDASRREASTAAILEVDVPFARSVAERVERGLGDFAIAWAEQGESACLATHEHLTQSATLLDLRTACLDRARRDFEAARSVLLTPDAEILAHADRMIEGLDSLHTCEDGPALLALVPPPSDPESAARVEDARGRLAVVRARRQAGDHKGALEAVERLSEESADVDYRPWQTELLLERGAILGLVGRVEEAEADDRAALRLALETGQWAQALVAVDDIVHSLGKQARTAEAEAFLAIGWGLVNRPEFGPADEARLRKGYAIALVESARFGDAEAELRRAIELTIDARGSESAEEGERRVSLAQLLFRDRRYKEAEVESRRALKILRHALGSEHPRVGYALNNLANSLWLQGKYADAELAANDALELFTNAHDSDHPDVALALATLGVVLTQAGRPDQAEPLLQRALAVRLARFGADHPEVGRARNSFAIAVEAQGRITEAEFHYREVLRSDLARLGADHPHLVRVRLSLARNLRSQGKKEAAREQLDEAVALAQRIDGVEPRDREHAEVALLEQLLAEEKFADAEILARRRRERNEDPEAEPFLRSQLAEVFIRLGRVGEARTELETAVEILSATDRDAKALQGMRGQLGWVYLEEHEWQAALDVYEAGWAVAAVTPLPPDLAADLAWGVAKSLDHLRRDPERAHSLAIEARKLYQSCDFDTSEMRTKIDRWLRVRKAARQKNQ